MLFDDGRTIEQIESGQMNDVCFVLAKRLVGHKFTSKVNSDTFLMELFVDGKFVGTKETLQDTFMTIDLLVEYIETILEK